MDWLVCTTMYGLVGKYDTKRDAYKSIGDKLDASKIWSGYYEVAHADGTGSTFFVGKVDRMRHDGWDV